MQRKSKLQLKLEYHKQQQSRDWMSMQHTFDLLTQEKAHVPVQ